MDNIYYSPVDFSTCSSGDYILETTSISNELISNIDNSLFIHENINFINRDNFYNDMYVIKLELLKHIECDTFLLDSQLNIIKNVKKDNKIDTIASEVLYLLIRDNSNLLIDNIKLKLITPILNKLNYDIEKLNIDLLLKCIKNLISKNMSDQNTKLINDIIDFKKDYIKKQDELLKLESNLINDININNDDIETIDKMLKKTKSLNNDIDNKENEKMIKTMLELSNMLYKNSNIINSKQKYIDKRKEMNNYINVIRYINNFNNCNICQLCLTNPIDHYIIPCGHTACSDCLTKQKQYQGSENFKCGLCRVLIEDTNKLYL